MPIAIHQSDANEQHYEVPSDFYLKFMGPYMKYSCGYWPNENTTLNESETIMLDMYCERAQLENGNIVRKNVIFTILMKFINRAPRVGIFIISVKLLAPGVRKTVINLIIVKNS